VYTTRCAALIARLQPLAQQMSALLNKGCSCACHSHQLAATPPPAAAAAAAAAAINNPSPTAASGDSSATVGVVSCSSSSVPRCCGCAVSSSASSCLSLEEAEALAGLLGQYEAAVGQWRLLGRSLSWHWLNTLSSRQLAQAAVAAYPMYLQPIQIRAVI
jgi:hypothetical protein